MTRSTRASKKTVIRRSSGNVVENVGFAAQEAEHLRIRSTLMAWLGRTIAERGLTQRAAAELLGVTQPRVSDLVRGKIDRFSIDTLVEMLDRTGFRVNVRVTRIA